MFKPSESLFLAILAAVIFLVIASPATAQDTCDVAIEFDDPNATHIVAFGLDYSSAGGSIIGDSSSPGSGPSWGSEVLACTPVPAEFYDAVDDNAGLLSVFLADTQTPWVGTVPLITCVLALDGGFPCPVPGDFAFVDAAFPNDPFPPPVVFPSLPGLNVASVTARIPVCGDGFLEGTEECDDGNTIGGDCCSSVCTSDAVGTPCDDGDVCTLDGTCDASGSCVSGDTLMCDDGMFCTHDQCDPIDGCFATSEPDRSCGHLSKATIDIRDGATNDKRDQIKFKARLHGGDIGDPAAVTDYALCIFDEVGGVSVLIDQIEVPAGNLWVELGNGGKFSYTDRLGSLEGVRKIRLRPQGKSGDFNVLFQARGENMTLPGPFDPNQYLADDEDVFVQLENSDGSCWSDDFDEKIKHKPDRFRAKH